MAKRSSKPRASCIYVLAGTNGAGKSTIGGAMFRQQGADYFNPDEAADLVHRANPHVTRGEANSAAWHEGRRLLERAISERLDFAFETTLGGQTITTLLERALSEGIEVRIWYVGLARVEMHIARVKERAARGGHDIPEQTIRERYDRSRINLIRLIPKLTELRVFDNSIEGDPVTGVAPRPLLVLHIVNGLVQSTCAPEAAPAWAKPILAAALL